jgi:hypothetical protein
MPQAHYINDPGHWRDRADEMRALAQDVKDEQARETMLRLAKDYDRRRARGQALRRKPQGAAVARGLRRPRLVQAVWM